MKKVILHPNHFDENMYWSNELKDVAVLDDADGLDLFDQNGYHLTNRTEEAVYKPPNRSEEVLCGKE